VPSSPAAEEHAAHLIGAAVHAQAKGRVERMNKTLQDRLVKQADVV
jgi:hypothetical protein